MMKFYIKELTLIPLNIIVSIVITFGLIKDAQAAQIRIAVLDSGLTQVKPTDVKLCSSGHMDFTGTGFADNMGHGTNVTYLIAERLKNIDYCIVIFKIFDPNYESSKISATHLALFYILENHNIDVVNYSAGGSSFSFIEKIIISGLIESGVKVISAAGNDGKDLDKNCYYYPACYAGVISVGNMATQGKRNPTSNYGSRVTTWEMGTYQCAGGRCMTGSSQATAIHTAKVVKSISKEKK